MVKQSNSTTKIILLYSQFVCSLYTQPSICLCLYFCFDLYLLCSIQKKDFFCVILGIQILLFHCPLVCKLYLFARPIDQLLQEQMSRLEAQKITTAPVGLLKVWATCPHKKSEKIFPYLKRSHWKDPLRKKSVQKLPFCQAYR